MTNIQLTNIINKLLELLISNAKSTAEVQQLVNLRNEISLQKEEIKVEKEKL